MTQSEVAEKKNLDDMIYRFARENWPEAQIRQVADDNELDEDEIKEVLRAVEVMKGRQREKATEPKQLEFFDKALLRITSKETERSLEAIVKELIRLGIPKSTIGHMVEMMGIHNEEVKGTAEKIDYL